jgi:hypothetical protein
LTKEKKKKKKFWAYDRLQVPDHSLEGYSHRERWSRTWWRFTSRRSSIKSEEENFESIIGGNYQKINSTFTPIGRADSRTRRFQEVKELKSKIEEMKDWKKSKIEVLRLNPSLQLELSLGGYWHGFALWVPAD